MFIAHGGQKLFGLWGGGGLSGTAAYFAQLGIEPAWPMAVAVGGIEFIGGILLVLAGPGAVSLDARRASHAAAEAAGRARLRAGNV